MTDKENNPDQYGKSDIAAIQGQDDWAVPPPPFHCEDCPHGSFGSIIEDTWEPKPCKCMEDQYLG